jgi:hypothetical protein
MRRVDVLAIGVAIFAIGGLLYAGLQLVGMGTISAGIWAQAILVVGLVGWVVTYAARAVTGNMTYHQQRREYEDAVLQKRLEEMTPEELAALQAEIEQEKAANQNRIKAGS